MKQAYIYGLVDPRDMQVHYIGHTVDLAGRFASHIVDNADTPKTQWIADAVSHKAVPYMILLETVLHSERFKQEYKWIYLGRSKGWPLTNTVAMKTDKYYMMAHGMKERIFVEARSPLSLKATMYYWVMVFWSNQGVLSYGLLRMLLALFVLGLVCFGVFFDRHIEFVFHTRLLMFCTALIISSFLAGPLIYQYIAEEVQRVYRGLAKCAEKKQGA
ncbi:MAG: hypothetical protein KDD28_27545 [Phaeodactylibacter sp.]|nr:hypothetical protein [Phaeodactylibacter sp.]